MQLAQPGLLRMLLFCLGAYERVVSLYVRKKHVPMQRNDDKRAAFMEATSSISANIDGMVGQGRL